MSAPITNVHPRAYPAIYLGHMRNVPSDSSINRAQNKVRHEGDKWYEEDWARLEEDLLKLKEDNGANVHVDIKKDEKGHWVRRRGRICRRICSDGKSSMGAGSAHRRQVRRKGHVQITLAARVHHEIVLAAVGSRAIRPRESLLFAWSWFLNQLCDNMSSTEFINNNIRVTFGSVEFFFTRINAYITVIFQKGQKTKSSWRGQNKQRNKDTFHPCMLLLLYLL